MTGPKLQGGRKYIDLRDRTQCQCGWCLESGEEEEEEGVHAKVTERCRDKIV